MRVLFDYEYAKKDSTIISIIRDQIYHLVDRTNDVWWRVRPTSKTLLAPEMKPGKAFYLPANYVEIENDISTLAAPTGNSSNGSRNSSRNGSLKSASSSSSTLQQQQQHIHQLACSSTPPQRYENWSVKTKASEPDNSAVSTPSIMSASLPPAAAAAATSDNDYSSKKSVAEKRQSFELMSSSTSSIGSVTSHVPVHVPASSLSFQPTSAMSQSQISLKGASTLPVAVPNIDAGLHPDDYDEVDDESGADGNLDSVTAHSQNRPLPRVPDMSHEGVSQLLSSSNQPTTVTTSSSSGQQKTHHQQSSSYDSGIDNPCYARLDELKQQMLATSISILGESGSGSYEKKLNEAGSNVDPEDEKTGSSNTLDTEDSQSIPDLNVLEIGGAGRSSFKSNSKPVNLSSFKNPLYQQQQQSNPQESGGGGSPLSSFGSLEKKASQRPKMLSDSSDDVFDDFMKKSSLLNSFTAVSTSTSSTTNAASLKSKAATIAVVEPPRVPATAFFDSSSPEPASGTKSLERDDQLPQRMESIGSSGGGSVGGVSRQRPNSFNYMGVKGSGVDMGVLKNQLRKTSSREMLAERVDDDERREDDEDDGLHRRKTVEETRKSLEDLSASAAADNESWRTKSCEHLIGGKSKSTRKEKLPPGWTKDFDSELKRDVYIFKDAVSLV